MTTPRKTTYVRKTVEFVPAAVRLKRPSGVFSTDDDWSVTGTYVVQVTARERLACVRVSNYGAKGKTAAYAIMHLSMREFRRLFRPRTRKEYEALMRAVHAEMRKHET